MFRFMAVCFLFLGWAFWELSGGADFEPSVRASAPEAIEEAPLDVEETVVARNATQATEPVLPQPTSGTTANTAAQVTLAAASAVEQAAADVVSETTQQAAAPAVAQPEVTPDLRTISGNRVNMRRGPGTEHGVVSKLSEGTEVEVLSEPGNGWLELRVVDSGTVGWIADWLVTASNG